MNQPGGYDVCSDCKRGGNIMCVKTCQNHRVSIFSKSNFNDIKIWSFCTLIAFSMCCQEPIISKPSLRQNASCIHMKLFMVYYFQWTCVYFNLSSLPGITSRLFHAHFYHPYKPQYIHCVCKISGIFRWKVLFLPTSKM